MVKLNIACGPDIKDGYQNIDFRDLPGVDTVQDIEILDYPDNSVDEIYAKEILEHISHLTVLDTLTKWYRWLKPKGTIYIKVPDLDECAKVILSGERLYEIVKRIYGGQQYKGNLHKSGFTKESLSKIMEDIGFNNVKTKTVGWNFEVEATK